VDVFFEFLEWNGQIIRRILIFLKQRFGHHNHRL
jgi:hypothetical protein